MFEINLGHYLSLGAIIFTIAVAGIFLNRKNIIVILMSIELILLAVNINLVSFSIFLNDLNGQIKSITPKPGTLILFPSYLEHKVEENLSNKERIVVSFNVALIRKRDLL